MAFYDYRTQNEYQSTVFKAQLPKNLNSYYDNWMNSYC